MTPTFRIFVSSPGDVGRERQLVQGVFERVAGRFGGRVKLDGYFWEHEPMRTTRGDFQTQIEEPAQFDLVICILWGRLGSRLHPGIHRRPDGSEYASGTEYEFESAALANRERGTPDLLVYRRKEVPSFPAEPPEKYLQLSQQWQALKRFCDHWFRDEEVGSFKAAYNSYTDLAEFETKLETHLTTIVREWLGKHGGPVAPTARPPTWLHESPYRGLHVFDFAHEPIFFGRTRARDEVLGALQARASEEKCPFVLILGASGSGKSSLLRAGVLPWLVRPGVIEGVGLWRRLVWRPSAGHGNLLEGLARALVGPEALPELLADGTTVETLVQLLRDEPRGIVGLVKGALSQAAAREQQKENLAQQPVARLALAIDQLEEIFTLAERFNPADRTALFRALAVLVRAGYAWTVITLRSDFYNRCEEVAELVELKKGKGQYHLLTTTGSELSQMIRYPAEEAGVVFEEDAVKGKLDEVIRDAALAQAGTLPLLEYVLAELYKRKTPANLITWEAYEQLGGLKGAISQRAEEVYHELSPPGRAALPVVLGALIAMGQTATARPASRQALTRHPGGEEMAAAYVKASLFVTDIDRTTGQPVVALAHEALISGWIRVQTWLHENEDFLRVKARIAQAAQRWREAGRERDFLLVEGKPLAEAEDALKKRRGELEPEEIEFVEVSSRTAARSRRIRRYQAAAILTVGLSLVFGSVILRQLQQKRDAQAAASAARLVTSASDSAQATQELQKNNVREALAYLADALRNNPGNAQATAFAISILRNSPLPLFSFRHEDEVHDVQFSPDGTRIVTASVDGTAQLWDAVERQKVGGPLPHKEKTWVHTASFSLDSKWVVTASWDGTARIWDARTGAPRLKAGTSDPIVLVHTKKVPSTKSPSEMADTPVSVTSAIFSPLGQWVVTTCADGKAHVWDAQTGDPVLNPKTHEPVVLQIGNKPVWAAAFSPRDGRYLATASEDPTALLIDTRTWDKPRELPHGKGVNGVNFSPDGRWLVTGSDDGKARVWDVQSEAKPTKPIEPIVKVEHALGVVQPVFSPDGRWFVTSSKDKTAQIWDAGTGAPHGKPMHHEGWVRITRFSPDGRLVATASADGTARIWDAETGNPVSNPMYHGSAVYALNFSPDGRFLATASFDHYGRLWPVQSTRVVNPMTHGMDKPKTPAGEKPKPHANDITAALFSPDGSLVLTASNVGTARLWDANTGLAKGAVMFWNSDNHQVTGAALIPTDKAVTCISFNSDGSRLMTGWTDGLVRIWNTKTQQTEGKAMEHLAVAVARFSPDRSMLVTGSRDGSVRLWDAEKGEIIAIKDMPNHSDEVTAITFSTDSRWILTASKDHRAMIWDVKERKLVRELPHNNGVNSVVFGHFAQGDWVLTASDDHNARVWNAQTGETISKQLMQHDGWIYDAEFSPKGEKVVTASADGTARVWDAVTGLPLTDPLRHKNAVITASFNRDGSRVVTASLDGSARVWDTATGQPVSVPFEHADQLTSASFSPDPDNELILTSSLDGTARMWGPVPTIKLAPDWLRDLMEYVGGLRLDSARNLVPTKKSATDLKDLISRLPPVDNLSKFAHWLVEDPATRQISPLPSISVPEFVRKRLEENTPEALKLAYEADPGNLLVLTRLAGSVAREDPRAAELYCTLALRRTRAGGDKVKIINMENYVRGLFPKLRELDEPGSMF